MNYYYFFSLLTFFKLKAANKSKQEMLRTGRNTTNSELNALARNRGGTSQKESPINRYII